VKSKVSPLPPVHDPRWVNRESRLLAKALGLSARVWFRQGRDTLLVLQSRRSALPQVYLSAGIHGDEPGSVLGLLQWLKQARRWLRFFRFTIMPCLNPGGLRLNTRADEAGFDLNRGFNQDQSASVMALRTFLGGQGPFALGLLLHEDYDAEGMYVYEVAKSRESWGEAILQAAAAVMPPDGRKKIEGRLARRGVIQRNLSGKKWDKFFAEFGLPEAVWLYRQGCPRVYTLETPSEFSLGDRAEAHRLAMDRALERLRETLHVNNSLKSRGT
jgi:murein peptide amidase A